MNALELADELEEFSGDGAFKYYLEIATMLRQQQAEIEALKNRELTDEEIEVLWRKYPPFDLTAGIDFANAILRKAQNG